MCVCAGYPRLLSGDLSDLTKVPEKQRVQFPEAAAEESWSRDPRWVKKYFLKFPFYPFRTLCPRDLGAITKTLNFDNASPIFPANTQLDLVFQKRKKTNFLKYMLPFNLNPNLGTRQSTCTAEEYTNALTFTQPATAGAVAVTYIIERVDINVTNMYLQVGYTHTHTFLPFLFPSTIVHCVFQLLRIQYKGLSPEKPLSNVFTSYRTVFTPLQRVSLHQYDLSWESMARPSAVYIGFVK